MIFNDKASHVILSAAKDLCIDGHQMFRFVQHDMPHTGLAHMIGY